MKTYGIILEVSQTSMLVKANNETFEVVINDLNRDFIHDALNEETFVIWVDSTNQEILLEPTDKELDELYSLYPEYNLEELEGATELLEDEYI